MDFGFARFLEMFEERFGRVATTAILAILGLAAAAWAVKTIVEAIIYVFHLIKSAKLLTALEQESAASHIVVFAVQIALTFLILGIIWRLFYLRQLRSAEQMFDASEARLNGLLERIKQDVLEFEQQVKEFDEREDRLAEKIAAVRAKQEMILAKLAKKSESPKSSDSEVS